MGLVNNFILPEQELSELGWALKHGHSVPPADFVHSFILIYLNEYFRRVKANFIQTQGTYIFFEME